MGIVFINYRRDETAGEARALYNDLVELLGADRVFMDVDDIALGRDFRQVLKERLDACDVMLSLIGREWAHARDAAGDRRLDNPADFVRIEIATALQRNVAVTPVLLQDARMPSAESLPDDLKDLAYRNGFELSHTRWESDVHELVWRLGLSPAAKRTAAAPAADAPAPPPAVAAATLARARSLTAVALGALGVVVAAALVGWMATRGDRPAQTPTPTPATAPARTPVPSTESRAAPEPSHAEIENLVVQINDDSETRRRKAVDRLRRDFAHSPLAVGLAGVAAGKAHLVPQVLDLVDQLGRRVGA